MSFNDRTVFFNATHADGRKGQFNEQQWADMPATKLGWRRDAIEEPAEVVEQRNRIKINRRAGDFEDAGLGELYNDAELLAIPDAAYPYVKQLLQAVAIRMPVITAFVQRQNNERQIEEPTGMGVATVVGEDIAAAAVKAVETAPEVVKPVSPQPQPEPEMTFVTLGADQLTKEADQPEVEGEEAPTTVGQPVKPSSKKK